MLVNIDIKIFGGFLMKKKSIVLILALVLIIATGVTAFSAQGVSHGRRMITIGWFGPMSGPFQMIGEGMVDGMRAKIDQINGRGGIGGYRLRLIALDNNMNPVQTKGIVKKLVKQLRVFAIVGALGSVGINAVINDLKSYGIPVVYLGGGEPHWSVPPKRNIFPIQPDYITEGRLLVKFAVQNLRARRIAFVYANNSTGRTALRGALIGMRRYGRRVGAKFVLKSIRLGLSVMKTRIKKANPDATIIFQFLSGAAGLVSGCKRAGIRTNWITTYVNSDSVLYKIAGRKWLGVYVAAWAKATQRVVTNYIRYFVKTKYYRKARRKRWDAPSGYHTAGWIAVEIFIGGLRIFQRKYRSMRRLTWDNYIRSMENMRNFNNTIAKDITYYPMSKARRGTRYYYLARSGQRTLYFTQAAKIRGRFYLKPVTRWMR